MTPKEIKKSRDNLKILHNRITSAWSFKKLKTWGDLFLMLGYIDMAKLAGSLGHNQNKELTYPDLKDYLEKQKHELEERIKQASSNEGIPQSSEISGVCTRKRVDDGVCSQLVQETTKVQEALPDAIHADVQVEVKEEYNADNDYGFIPSPNETGFFPWFQRKAITEITKKVLEGKTGILLLSGTGTGKTYMVTGVVRRLFDINYHEGRTWSHIPYIWVTKTTVVEQASRVLKNVAHLEPINDVEVLNIEQLRSKAGALWLKQECKIINGEEFEDWKWKANINPCVFFFDESQGAKNVGSTQSKIVCAYNDLKANACLISISATPFTRVSEAKAFAVSTHRNLEHLGFPKGTRLTNDNWPTYAAMIASPSSPNEYNQAAIERLMKDLDEYIVRVRGVRPQFNAKNQVRVIPFETKEKRAFYEDAWNRFVKEKAKMEDAKAAGLDGGNYMFVILLKFAMAAELIHAEHFADDMYNTVANDGKAAVAAVKFKGTIIEIVKILNEKYGVPREHISLIWGGGQTQLTKKQKARKKIKELDEKFKAMGLSAEELLEDMDLDEVEDRELQNLPAHLRLGQQTMEERQKEIDAFQRGDSLFALYTFKAGGVGLSLHHCDELTTFKCRRKASGYAVEEDIPKVPVRPRRNHVALTYNAIELVQGVGRCPRLTSLSDTEQFIYAYEGTIEVDIGNIVSQKLRCLSSVVKQKEDWQQCIMTHSSSERAQKVKEIIAQTEGAKDDEDGLIDESEDEN